LVTYLVYIAAWLLALVANSSQPTCHHPKLASQLQLREGRNATGAVVGTALPHAGVLLQFWSQEGQHSHGGDRGRNPAASARVPPNVAGENSQRWNCCMSTLQQSMNSIWLQCIIVGQQQW